MIDSPAIFNRAMSWLSYAYKMEGELYWGTNFADHEYRGSSWSNQYLAGGNGDGSLTYPGRPDVIGGTTFIPIASMRLKMIRDSLEDWEYMHALEQLSGRDAAMAQVSKVVTTAYNFTHDPAVMQAVRLALGKLVSEATALAAAG